MSSSSHLSCRPVQLSPTKARVPGHGTTWHFHLLPYPMQLQHLDHLGPVVDLIAVRDLLQEDLLCQRLQHLHLGPADDAMSTTTSSSCSSMTLSTSSLGPISTVDSQGTIPRYLQEEARDQALVARPSYWTVCGTDANHHPIMWVVVIAANGTGLASYVVRR
jgi:hypothetical protein